MNRAFLSHSSRQKDLVRQVANNLGKGSCVFDDFEFEAGMPIFDEIVKGIGESNIFVFFISDDSLNSGWVQQEITELKNLIDNGLGIQFLPILVDKSLSITSDKRIPSWITKYLLKPITDHFLITKKIKQRLREVVMGKNPLFKAKESLFVGRQDILDQFETKLYSISEIKAKSIVVSGIEGIGRRTFLKKALKWDGRFNDYYEPIYITLDTKDSIEDFILKLQDTEGEMTKSLLEQLTSIDFEQKVHAAKELLMKVKGNNEYVFIIDSGCIIKPSKQVAAWFLEIIDDREFDNVFTVCVATRFRPSNEMLRRNSNLIHFHLGYLSEKDTEKLFVKYCSLLKLDLKEEHGIEILSLLNGIPSQVHYAVELINEYGIVEAIKLKRDILDFGETQVFYIVEAIKSKGTFAFELLVLISNFEFVSYDFVYSIVGEREEVGELLEDYYISGVFDLIGANKEYIKVHYPIADYLTRSKATINSKYKKKLKENIKLFVQQESTVNDYQDISELLHNIKGAIIEGYNIPDKYYIPSFVLKTIVDLYYLEHYTNVISLIDKVLENAKKLDKDLIREFIYWLCLSLARQSNPRFELEVESIEGADYFYLNGFYYRIRKQLDKAESFLKNALSRNAGFQRAKRELVNVLLLKSNFIEAFEMAKANYEKQKLNAFHIQAYFLCIIKKKYLSGEDKKVLQELSKNIARSYDFKAKEISSVMQGEYEYYVNNNIAVAIEILRECIKKNKHKHYPKKALEDIYRKADMIAAANEIGNNYKDIPETFSME